MQKRIKTISEHYGLEHQLLKTIEECWELIVACLKVWIFGLSVQRKKELVTEIADVRIMTAQLTYLTETSLDVTKETLFKLDRQMERMKNGK